MTHPPLPQNLNRRMRKFPVRVCPAPSEDADPVDPAAALDLRKSNRRSLNAPDLENPAAGAPSTAMTVAPSLNTSLRLVNVPGVRLNALTGAAFARIAEKSNRRSTNNPSANASRPSSQAPTTTPSPPRQPPPRSRRRA